MAKAKAKTKSAAAAVAPPKAAPPPSPAGKGLGFKVSPTQKDEALRVLEAYVAERAAVTKDKAKLTLRSAIELMHVLNTFKESVADMVKSPAEKAYDALRFATIPEFMDEQDIRTITIEGIGRVNATDDIQVSTLDKPGLQKWLGDEDLDDLIVPTVNAQTLSAALRKRIKEGKSLPPENVVKVTPVVRAQITKV